MRNRIFAVIAIAVLAGGGLAYGTYNFMQNQPVKTVNVATQPVVVAAADLSLGAELKKEDLTVASYPAGQVPEGVFATAQEIIGRGIIVPIVKNEPILAAKLASKEAGSGLPPVATASPTMNQTDTTSKVVLANVQVLTAGTRMEQDHEKGKPMQVTVVTLLVTPEQVERLALASTEGKIQLALRNPLDQGAPVTPGIKPSGLMGMVKAVAPANAPRGASAKKVTGPVTMESAPALPPAPTVEMIRGDKRATEIVT